MAEGEKESWGDYAGNSGEAVPLRYHEIVGSTFTRFEKVKSPKISAQNQIESV